MSTNLNLARKWRSKSFDQIVGQALPIRMLKNSLYLESFFPVYLFSGQRGCGKTTMARVFASAINCEQLPNFQKNPKTTTVPCLNCQSCVAMQTSRHPDFIEIDAASYTGVDNVRNIIDASSLLPVLGRKKIYLIDEAHMLSKAAFNAFLKILEEPPASVVFILATTDGQKIIDTVKSRCFQLFFTPIDQTSLSQHLATICKSENIQFDQAGLELIVKTTEGSARDAINLLEQVRFSTSSVTKAAVLNVLGHFDDERLLALFNILLTKKSTTLLKYLHDNKVTLYSAEFIWHKLIELARAALWMKHGVQPEVFLDHCDQLKKIVAQCSMKQLHDLLDIFYNHESLLLKTTAQHGLLEMILLKFCYKNGSDNSGASSAPQNATAADQTDAENLMDAGNEDDQDIEQEDDEEEVVDTIDGIQPWQKFLLAVQTLNDPLLNSVLSQGKYMQCDDTTKKLDVEFSKELALFKDWLDDSNKSWQPLLNKAFGGAIHLNANFNGEQKKVDTLKKNSSALNTSAVQAHAPKPMSEAKSNVPANTKSNASAQYERPYKKPYTPYSPKKNMAKESLNPRIDVSDITLWKKANMILQYFPGTIREIKESTHEQNA